MNLLDLPLLRGTLKIVNILTQEFVFTAIDAEKAGEPFPVDFANVWGLLGYSRKDNAIRALRHYCTEGVDFVVSLFNEENSEGRPSQTFRLSIDAFKSFCMVADTGEGREVREYFIEIEKAYRKTLERQFSAPASPSVDLSSLYSQLSDAHVKIVQLETDISALQMTRNDITQVNQVKVWKPCKDEFSIPLQAANDVIGYHSIKYLQMVVKEEFVRDVDYRLSVLGEYSITEACFHELVVVARPQKGAKVSNLPELLIVERDRMFRNADFAANRRFGRSV